MTKDMFLTQLKEGLKKAHIHDLEEIIEEYTTHFDVELNLGKHESDIAKSLGDIDSIIKDYVMFEEKRKNPRLFTLITSSIVAVPLLFMMYGVYVVIIAGTITSWSLGVYYLFSLSSLSFLPTLIFGLNFAYSLLFFSIAIWMFSSSTLMINWLKSLTKQYFLRGSVRVGAYHVKKVYTNMFKWSGYISLLFMVIVYALSWFLAGTAGFWHEWHWFD